MAENKARGNAPEDVCLLMANKLEAALSRQQKQADRLTKRVAEMAQHDYHISDKYGPHEVRKLAIARKAAEQLAHTIAFLRTGVRGDGTFADPLGRLEFYRSWVRQEIRSAIDAIAGEWLPDGMRTARAIVLLELRGAALDAVDDVVRERIEVDPYNNERLWRSAKEKVNTARKKRDRARKEETRAALTEEVLRLSAVEKQLRKQITLNSEAEVRSVYKDIGGRLWPEGV